MLSVYETEERYCSFAQVWTGKPNATPGDYGSDLPFSTALDVGCELGADNQWLQQRGWQVPGIDLASIAVVRERACGAQAEVSACDEFS